MQHIIAIPFCGNHASIGCQLVQAAQNAICIITAEGGIPNNDHRIAGLCHHLCKRMGALCQRVNHRGLITQPLNRIGEVCGCANRRNLDVR